MPTTPLHHGWTANHAITSTPSSCSCFAYSSKSKPFELTAASDIDANARVAVAGQIGVSQRVSLVSPIALAVWEILQDRRNRMLFGIIRQPDAGCQHRAIFQRYQRVLDDTHGAWKSGHNHRDPQLARLQNR